MIRPLERQTGKSSDPTYHLNRKQLRLLQINEECQRWLCTSWDEHLVALGQAFENYCLDSL